MAIKRLTNNDDKKSVSGWLVDIQPGGRGGKSYRKTFRTQAEAKVWETWLKAQVNSNAAWAPEKRDTRKLLALAEIWYESHGRELQAAEDTYKRIKAVIEAMGNPIASDFDVTTFTKYRAGRIDAGITLSMRYAHLAPSHLEAAKTLNPISALTVG